MANIHSLNIGGSTYVIEPNLINITAKTSGMSYVAFFSDRRAGGRYAYSYYGAFLNNTTGELQIPHLRLKHTNGNYGSYLRFGDGNYSYIFENPDDKLNIFSSRGSYIIGGPTYISSDYAYVSNNMYFHTNILPVNDSYSDIGTSDKRFKTIYADTFNGNATNAVYTDQVAIHTKEFIKDSGICSLNGIYEVPVILGGCDCTIFSGQTDVDFFGLMTDYHPQNNNSNWLRYNFNDQTLKSTNFEGNLNGNATTATNATRSKTTYLTYIKCETTTNQSYLINFGNKKTGDTYTYSSSKLTFNPSTGELQTYNLRLKNSGNYGSYLKFGDNNYCYIWESPDDTLRIHSSNGLYVTNSVTATNFEGNLTADTLKTNYITSSNSFYGSGNGNYQLMYKLLKITVRDFWKNGVIEIPVTIRHQKSKIILKLFIITNETEITKVELYYNGDMEFERSIRGCFCSYINNEIIIWGRYGENNDAHFDIGPITRNQFTKSTFTILNTTEYFSTSWPNYVSICNSSEFKSKFGVFVDASPENVVVSKNTINSGFCYSIQVVSSSQYTNLTAKDPNTLYLII